MSEIDKESIIIIVVSLLITGFFIICIKCYYYKKTNQNEFNQISKTLKNTTIMDYHERTQLI